MAQPNYPRLADAFATVSISVTTTSASLATVSSDCVLQPNVLTVNKNQNLISQNYEQTT